MRLALYTTAAQYDGLWRALERVRTNPYIRVEREALSALLKDHARLIAHHRGEITEYPDEQTA